MARIAKGAVTSDDLLEYLAEASDFGFELRTLMSLRRQGLQCQHGGLYEDPVTKKPRQFDIRAVARSGSHCVRLAIECKNIGENYPLLVSCVPRQADESFHEIAIVGEIEDGENAHGLFQQRAHPVRVSDPHGLYRTGSPVGKSLAQVGREANREGSITATDAEVFDRYAQSLASAADLIYESHDEGSEYRPSISYVAVFPLVVVPDGRLWQVRYDLEGQRTGSPETVDHCTLFVNREYPMSFNGPSLHVSHVDFVTLAGLHSFVSDCFQNPVAMETVFPEAFIEDVEEDLRSGRE